MEKNSNYFLYYNSFFNLMYMYLCTKRFFWIYLHVVVKGASPNYKFPDNAKTNAYMSK